MFPLIKWYQNIGINHLKKSIRPEYIRLVAESPSQDLPYLHLMWTINNGSETEIEVKRMYGSIYIGNKCVASFDAHKPVEKQSAAGSRQQYLTIQKRILKTGHQSGVEFNFNPTIDFWISTQSNTCLLDGAFEVSGYGLNITIPLIKDNLNIEGITPAISNYQNFLRSHLGSILKGV